MKKKLLDMTRAELLAEGFGVWDSSGLLLIPLRLYEKIPDGTPLKCINRRTYIKGGQRIDEDTRGGLLAYGWIPKK